jgi:hypothetical protein
MSQRRQFQHTSSFEQRLTDEAERRYKAQRVVFRPAR